MLKKYSRHSALSARVAHAYFKYGCFCSRHPIATILFSIATSVLLSYPLFRLGHVSSAPFEIVTVDNISQEALASATGADSKQYALLKRRSPIAYVQQIIVRARVHPWDPSELTTDDAVKGPLSLSFDCLEQLSNFHFDAGNHSASSTIDDYCFRVHEPNLPTFSEHSSMFPAHACLVLSPTLFWRNERRKFHEDGHLHDTIFEPHCSSSFCVRHFLLGMTGAQAGIKRGYRTNRQRYIQYAITLVLNRYDPQFVAGLKEHLKTALSQQQDSSIVPPTTPRHNDGRQEKFVLICYFTPHELMQHIPLIVSYCMLLMYLYFSVRKIEMVKSKWGLGVSAVFTVASSLVMASGICVSFDLIPRLWRVELFPYLAMILGMENVLCLTRAVVTTPVTLDVKLRIAHGLSLEGWLITKNFLIELAVVFVGLLTQIPEIQEFCTLGCIGLVVDFYMQLFFYAPCLTFDMLRFDIKDKQRLRVVQLSMNPVQLQPYPPVKCPIMGVYSRLFRASEPMDDNHQLRQRASSMSSLTNENNKLNEIDRKPPTERMHRRTASNTSQISLDMETPVAPKIASVLFRKVPLPRRLKVLLFWSRYRYFQRICTFVVVVWIVWLALIVHQLRFVSNVKESIVGTAAKLPHESGLPTSSGSPVESKPDRPSAPAADGIVTLESYWVHRQFLQRAAFRLWPVLFDIYNISLTNQYIVLLPRLILNADVSPRRATATRNGVEPSPVRMDKGGTGFMNDLGGRISWLEFQMVAVLLISAGIFAIVAGFILYVCFVGGDSEMGEIEADRDTKVVYRRHKRIGSKSVVDVLPTVFRGHISDVEMVCYSDMLVSSCLQDQVLVWDIKTGDLVRRIRPETVAPNVTQRISNGDAELSNWPRHRRGTPQTGLESRSSEWSPSSIPRGSGTAGGSLLDFNSGDQKAIWCICAQSRLIIIGYSNGDLEVYDCRNGALRSKCSDSVAATQICMKGSHVIVARLNGRLDFMDLRVRARPRAGQLLPEDGDALHLLLLKSVTAHQCRINRLAVCGGSLVTASDDHTLKLFDSQRLLALCTLYGHNAPVVNLAVDEQMQMMYSSCADGLICIWDLVDRCLVRTLFELNYTMAPVSLALTNALLVGHAQDGGVWMWRKQTGELITRLKAETDAKDGTAHGYNATFASTVAVLNDTLAVTTGRGSLRFWDLQYKMLAREVRLSGEPDAGCAVKHLMAVDSFSVVCSQCNVLYRVSFPMIRA